MRAFRPQRAHSALADISAETVAEVCQVHISTARRWKRGEDPPHAAVRWVQVCVGGDLGEIDPVWSGWRLSDGQLISPEGLPARPGDILALPFQRRLIAHYQAEARLPRQADWVSEAWEPAKESAG